MEGYPNVGKYQFPKGTKLKFKDVELPKMFRPPSLLPKGVKQPLAEYYILWRKLWLNRR